MLCYVKLCYDIYIYGAVVHPNLLIYISNITTNSLLATIMAITIMENEMQCIISNNMILMCSFN